MRRDSHSGSDIEWVDEAVAAEIIADLDDPSLFVLDHLSDEEATAYMFDMLGKDERKDVETHLLTCRSCAEKVDLLRGLDLENTYVMKRRPAWPQAYVAIAATIFLILIPLLWTTLSGNPGELKVVVVLAENVENSRADSVASTDEKSMGNFAETLKGDPYCMLPPSSVPGVMTLPACIAEFGSGHRSNAAQQVITALDSSYQAGSSFVGNSPWGKHAA